MAKVASHASSPSKLSAPFEVALSQLWLSEEDNVRDRNSVSSEGIKQMSAMLLSQGQINPLVVSKTEDNQYTVHAGGRRLRGFWLLREQGKIKEDFAVQVREVDPSVAIDISLVENLSQEPMHPVDEFLAFRRLADKGQSPEQIAKAFGCKVLHVKRRMKLGEVHSDLLAQFREGNVTLDQIMALASCDDQQRQLQAWNTLPTWQRSDHQIRQHLAEDQVPADDDRVQLVGLDNYLQAGGSVRTDLFSEDGRGELLTDVGLLEMLVSEKLEAAAEQLRGEGWAWVQILQNYGYEERQKIRAYPTTYLPETEQQAAERNRLEQQIAEKEDAVQALWDKQEDNDEDAGADADADADADEALIEKLQQEAQALEEKIEALQESHVDLQGVDMRVAGAVVFVCASQIVVHKPMIKIEDFKKIPIKSSPSNAQSTQGLDDAGDGASEVMQQAQGISDRLLTNLTAHRTAAVQASLLAHQKMALAVLATHLAQSEFLHHFGESPLKVSFTAQMYTLRDASPTLEGSPAQQALLNEHDAIAALIPSSADECLPFFLEQDTAVSLRIIAYCTAISINGVRRKSSAPDTLAPIAKAVSLDMRQWWQANQPNYLSMVPKAKMIEAVIDAHGGPLAAEGWDKLKKDEVIDRCTDSLMGTGWLPLALR
jgi:ParB family chromosome partitioning protein